MKIEYLRSVIKCMPAIHPYLKGRARFMAYTAEPYKSYDYYLANIQGLVNGVYSNYIGGEFIDSMANLISGQLLDAYQQAIADQGFTDFFLPDYLQSSLDALILSQYEAVDGFFRDIVDARIDGTPIDPLLSRAKSWAHQWDVAYEQARQLMNMKNGGNLIWRKGATEKGCSTCASLDGICMWASEWEQLGVHPRGYPNKKLQCEGGGPVNNCDCTLEPTEQRRTAGAYGKVEEITL